MEKNVIITISRQFGSNGREIARKLAEYLDISYYNKEILERIAVNMGVCADFFKDQNQDANGLFTIESKGLLLAVGRIRCKILYQKSVILHLNTSVIGF